MAFDWWTDAIDAAQAEHRERFAALFRGEALDQVPAIAGPVFGSGHGLAGTDDPSMLQEPDLWLAGVLEDMRRQSGLLADPVTFRPPAVHIDPLGVHFLDAVLGARVRLRAGQFWGEGLSTGIEGLHVPDLTSCPLTRSATDLARRAVAASQGRLLVGTPVLSCVTNLGMNLFGSGFLVTLAAEPERWHAGADAIHQTILAAHEAFRGVIPEAVRRTSVPESRYAPPGFGLIDGCATQLLSPWLYRDHIAPLDREALAGYPNGGMIHLCGAHTQHIPVWREMAELRSLQLNDRAAEDFELYYRGLRDAQVFYVAPTERMTVERILRTSAGRRVVIQAELREPIKLPMRG